MDAALRRIPMTDDPSIPPAVPRPSRSGLAWIWVLVLPLVGAVGGLLVAVVIAYVSPKQFESVAVVQVRPIGEPAAGIGSPMPQPDIATLGSVLVSVGNLETVVEELDLPSRWMVSPDEAIEVLEDSVETEVIVGTDLIRIRVRHTNPDDARDIAKAVVEAYIDREANRAMQRGKEVLYALDDELRELEDQAEERRKVMETVRANGGDGLEEATREYESAQAMLEAMKVRFASQRIALKIPKLPLTVHEEPRVGRAPVAPKVTAILVSGFVVGGGAGLLLGIVIAWVGAKRRG